VIDQYHQRQMEPSIGLGYREQAEWAKSTRHAANGLVIALEYRRCQCGTLVIDRSQTEVEIRLCSCRGMQSPKQNRKTHCIAKLADEP
jgi:hypothetical protein